MTVMTSDDLQAAFQRCAAMTRKRARNFYYGLKLLPEPQRSALYAVYAWMRRADDLVDGSERGPGQTRQRIEAFRAATASALDGQPVENDPVLVALAHTATRFRLPAEHLHAMLDGQLDDLDIERYDTFDALRAYCQRVASSVGLLCMEIWGYTDPAAPALAVDRGIAFQLTNILRDFAQDYDGGRVYLPREDFAEHRLAPEALRQWSDPDRCTALVESQVKRAQSYYDRAADLEAMITPTCAPTLWAMTAIYHDLLLKIRREPARIAQGPRLRLSSLHKGLIAIRARWGGRAIGNGRP